MTEKKPFSIWILLTVSTVVCTITVLTLVFITLLKGRTAELPSPQMIGKLAPDFNLPSLNGEYYSLEEMRGKPVLINFWATWCYPCQEEMPLLTSTHQAYTPNLIILGINEGESVAEVNDYIKSEKVSFEILIDKNEQVGSNYKITGYPTSIFIDKDGIIQAIYLGEISAEKLEDNLRLIGVE